MTTLTTLDKALEFWIDRSIHIQIAHKIFDAMPSRIEDNALQHVARVTLHSEQFRTDLLHTFDDPLRVERYFRGLTLTDMLRNMDNSMGDTIFPYLLWKWCRDSRRVFALSAELQEALLAASFDPSLNFTDTTFPYRTFMLKLHTPLRHPDTGQEYDYLFVHNASPSVTGNSSGTLMIYCLNTKLEDYRPFEQQQRDRFRKLPPKLGMKRVEEAFSSQILELSHAAYGGLRYTSATSFARAEREVAGNKLTTPMCRLAIGFMLYWQTLPPGSSSRSGWQGAPQPPSPNPNSVANGAQICTVGAGTLLSNATDAETTSSLPNGETQKYELPTHERGSYWRRAPGTGNDPNAPRVVYVKQTTVRADRLRPGELPAGALSKATVCK